MFAFSLGFQMADRFISEYMVDLGASGFVVRPFGTFDNIISAVYPNSRNSATRFISTPFSCISKFGRTRPIEHSSTNSLKCPTRGKRSTSLDFLPPETLHKAFDRLGIAGIDTSGFDRSYASKHYTRRVELTIKQLKVALSKYVSSDRFRSLYGKYRGEKIGRNNVLRVRLGTQRYPPTMRESP